MATARATTKSTLTTVEEFLARPSDGTRYELVDGELRAQDPASDTHGTIHDNLAFAISGHLRTNRPGCRLVVAPGVQPRLAANWNYREPELGVTCAPNRQDQHMVPEPVLHVEILSPSNVKDTWSNIPLYATLPSVQEILIVGSTEVGAQLLARGADGSWPRAPERIEAGGTILLESIGLEVALAEVYRGAWLAG